MPPAPRDYRGHVGRRIALRDLEARFVHAFPGGWRRIDELARPGATWAQSGGFDRAHGLQILCPKCFTFNGGNVGTHICLCWFVGCVPDDREPVPGRWTPSGTGMDDLTFVPGTPPKNVSVKLETGCGWHGIVIAGAIESSE